MCPTGAFPSGKSASARPRGTKPVPLPRQVLGIYCESRNRHKTGQCSWNVEKGISYCLKTGGKKEMHEVELTCFSIYVPHRVTVSLLSDYHSLLLTWGSFSSLSRIVFCWHHPYVRRRLPPGIFSESVSHTSCTVMKVGILKSSIPIQRWSADLI